MIAKKEDLTGALVFISIVLAICGLIFIVAKNNPPTYPDLCIEKLERFAGEDGFSMYECKRDFDRAENLRIEKESICR